MRKYLIGLLVVLAVLATVTIVVTPTIVSTRIAGAEIAQRIEAWTGGQVTLSQEPVVSIFPALSVTVEDVTISGRDGAGEPPLITVPSLTASLKILPLLTGRLEVGRLTLDRPRIHLLSDGLTTDGGQRDAAIDGALSGKTSVSLSEIVLRDGTISYRNRRSGRTYEVTSTNLHLTWKGETRAASMNAEFVWRGRKIELEGDLDDGWAAVAGEGSPGSLTLASNRAQRPESRTPGRADSVRTAPDAAGSDTAPRDLVERLGLPIVSGPAFGPLRVEGIFRMDATAITLSDASFEFDGNTAEGELVLSRLGSTRPFLQGSIVFEELDLLPYLEAYVPRSLKAFLALSVPVDWLDEADADVQLLADEIDLGHMRIAGTVVRLQADGGRMTIGLGHSRVAGGRVAGQAAIEPAGDGAAIELLGEVADLSVAEIGQVASLMRSSRLIGTDGPPEGTATGAFELSSRGNTVGALIRSLTGRGVVDVRNGSLVGADIVSTLERLSKGNTVIAEGEQPFIPVAGRTPFTRLTAYVALGSGVARAERVRIAGERFEITMSGQSDLERGEMEAEGVASLFAPAKGDGRDSTTPVVELPFGVGGTVREPVVAPGIPRVDTSSNDAAINQPSGGGGRFVPAVFPVRN